MLILINGVEVQVSDLPDGLKLEASCVYVYEVLDKAAIQFCQNPPPDAPYQPNSWERVSTISREMLNNICFFNGTDFSSRSASWAVAFGFYYQNGQWKLCILKFGQNHFSLVEPFTNKILENNISPSKIRLVEKTSLEFHALPEIVPGI
jgi:hypothetical protein